MNELDLIDSKIIPTSSIGNLNILCTLLEYDYPRCFIAKSDNGKFYALIENEDGFDKFGWNVTEVSIKDINLVNKSKKSVQSLFLNKKNSFLLFFENGAEVGNITRVNSFEGKYKIQGDLYVKDFADMDDLFDMHEIHKRTTQTGNSSISLVLEDADSSNTGSILNWIKYIIDICKNLKKPLDINNSMLSVQKGSTVITFEFNNDNNNTLFTGSIENDDNNIGINQLGNILGANTPEAIITEQPEIKAIQKYTKMVENLKKQTNARPKVVLSVPQSDRTVSYKFNDENCERKIEYANAAKKLAETNLVSENKNIEIEGILTGILTDEGKNQFSFKGSNNIIYKGMVDFTLLGINSTFVINSYLYAATIKETIIKENNVEIKSTYKLMNLKPISPLPKCHQTELFEN